MRPLPRLACAIGRRRAQLHSSRTAPIYAIHNNTYKTFTSLGFRPSSSNFHRSDFTSQPYTGSYEAGLPTSGPLGSAPSFGVPRLTPRELKQYLDQFVVGQDRAKKILSVAVYNHYQRILDIQRQEEAGAELMAKRERRAAMEAHPIESEFPGQQRTINMPPPLQDSKHHFSEHPSLTDESSVLIEKSNILLLGPSGVGKTLMAKTLARVLDVPFSMSDCTPFTQAGYIGEDAEVCVHRLLAAANYDVEAAERGIICLDEVDKIATARVSHGKDVSGEGVQQALLKIIEGTTIQVQAKPEKQSPRPTTGPSGPFSPGGMPGSGFSSSGSGSSPPSKGEVYNVRTDNILFVFSGAFVGLNKVVMDRIFKGSMGFGQPIRASSAASPGDGRPQAGNNPTLTPVLPGSDEEALYKKHLPFFTSVTQPAANEEPIYFNPLDLLTPTDLQSFGFIPELVGRIPVTTALSPLTHTLLLRILTEPRNSLVRQYEALFDLSGIKLGFTTAALHKVAANALSMGTGARALRTELETLLSDPMFETPGSSVKFVLVTENVADRKEKPIYLARGHGSRFHSMIATEESEWEARVQREGGKASPSSSGGKENNETSSFAEYRNRASTAM